jgi:ADP-heptose:LPS heptosyltransferase
MARALGADGPVVFPLPDGGPPAMPAGQPLPDKFILLHPFSRGAGKSLAPELVRQFCEAVQPLPVVLAGRTEGGDRPDLPPAVTDLLNSTTLPQLAWLMRRAAWTVSVDSGPMHMAAGLSPRVLGLHTWSDPRRVGPWCPDAFVWKAGRLCAVRDLDATAGGTGRPVTADDIPALAEFVRKQVGS